MQRPRTPSQLSESLHQRLNSYALAASAAGVGMLALAQPAEAKIVYTRTHHILTNGTLPIPVAGTNVFNLSDKFYISTGSWSSQFLNINASGSAAVVGGKGSAYALRRGQVIGSKDGFQTGKGLMAGAFCETQISASSVFGPFANTTQRYLGLKFNLHGKFHYGWARFNRVKASACNGGPAISATLTGYAYETIPNKFIIAGKTHGGASLGALAAGSTALSRRQHKIRSK